MKKTIFVVGAGKGLGNAVAKKFGQNDFKVVLMSRNAENLESYKAEFEAEGLEAEILVADAVDGRQFAAALNKAKENYGTPDVLFYNVGITTPDDALPQGVDAELLMQRYQIDVAGAYTAVQTIMDDEFAGKEGSILITGGGLAMYPYAGFLPLSMDKAALRAMVLALNPAYKEKGVFIGAVQVCDTIGGSEKYMQVNIAEKFWELYQNRSDAEIVY
ncbi:MAG: SDR family NAD(P)-dependent oxidoreductase [Lachnospiraceae bacterium]|nr:SDR family NAD(P)-dependent oxidoreductase [Lachnospiraceae bacterium]